MPGILGRIAGKVCEVFLPIRQDVFIGNHGASVAICTLSSIDLLESIARSDLMAGVALAGRLFSENKGIEKLVRYMLEHPGIRHLVLCGKDAKGHLPGQSLLALYTNGVGEGGRIIGALGKDPVLENLTDREIKEFGTRVKLIDMIGVTDIDENRSRVRTLL